MIAIYILGIISVIAQIVQNAVFALLHWVPSPYRASRNAVSDYGVGVTKRLFTVYLWWNTFGTVLLLLLFFFRITPVPLFIETVLLLVVIARTGIVFFPTDLEGESRTKHGRYHALFAAALFILSVIAIGYLTLALHDFVLSSTLFKLLVVFALLTVMALILTLFGTTKLLKSHFPVFERVFIVVSSLWFFVFSIAVLTMI